MSSPQLNSVRKSGFFRWRTAQSRGPTANQLAAIVESSNDAIVDVTLAGVITSWNPAAERIFGYTAEEIVGKPVTVLVPQELAGEEARILARARRGERVAHHETVRVRRGGARVNVWLTVSPVRDDAGEIVGAVKIVRDITELKRAAEAAAQMRLAIEAAPNGMVMIDESGAIVMVNSQMERLFGYARGEMLGQRIEMLLPERYRADHPSQRQEYLRSPLTRAMGHGRDLFARRKDGTEFPVEVGLNPAETPDGRFVLAAVIDITERKRMEAELATAHAAMREHAQRLEATIAERTASLRQTISELESVSYSLSHDLRAPLRTIHGFCQIVLEEAGEHLRPEHKDLLSRSINAANRLDRLIQDVLTYTRVSRQHMSLHPVEIEPLVRQIIAERPEFQPPNAEIVVDGPIDPVVGHEASLTQVITNLLDNSVKFMPPGRQPRVRVHGQVEGDRVRLCFEDNGIGIPKESQSQLFEIFQRLHNDRRYPGTGMGLAIVRKAVERMNGTVSVQSEVGRGTCFCIQLARAPRS